MDQNYSSKASLIETVEYIEQHHCELNEQLQKVQTLLQQLGEKLKGEYGSTLISLQEFYAAFKDALQRHFAKEETILFPYIRKMDDFDKDIGPKPDFQHSSIKNAISQIEYDHDQVENVMFEKLHDITGNYQLPQDANAAFKALYDGLKDIESSIAKHIEIEQKILFPHAIKLELKLMFKKAR